MTFSCILNFDWPPLLQLHVSSISLFPHFSSTLVFPTVPSLISYKQIYSSCSLQHPLPHVSFPDTWPLRALTTTSTQLSKNLSSRSTYEREHPVFVSLGMACYTQYNIFQFHSFSCRFYFSLMLSKIQLCEWFTIVTYLFYN